MKHRGKIALFLLVGTLSLVWIGMRRTLIESVIFQPDRPHDFLPKDYGLPSEEIEIRTQDGLRLHGWFIASGEPFATLIFLHGNAGNISHRLENARYLHAMGLNVLLADYRGYGKSEGRPTELGVYLDAQAMWDAALGLPGVRADQMVVFGRSLGGAVAIDLATKRPAAALIVEGSFGSIRAVARSLLPGLHLLVGRPFDSASKLKHIKCPKLFIHGERDRVVPFNLGKKLYEAAKPPKAFLPLPEAGHNDTYLVGGSAYFDKLEKFIRSALEMKPAEQ